MKGIKNECQLMERCDGHGVGGWTGGMVGVDRWDGYDGDLRKSWKV